MSATVYVLIDLTGSTDPTLGPAWRRVEYAMDASSFTDYEAIRRGAAEHCGVPLEQVGPVTMTATMPDAATLAIEASG